MYKEDLALYLLQWLKCYQTQRNQIFEIKKLFCNYFVYFDYYLNLPVKTNQAKSYIFIVDMP